MAQKSFLTLVFVLVLFACKNNSAPLVIYAIGDSTMSVKKQSVYPETGWCQVLDNFFKEAVIIKNHAVNGRSSKSFIQQGRWQNVLDSLKKGDILFVQFGHNDQKESDSSRYAPAFGSYTDNLKRFVTEARSRGAEPILFTPIVRRIFDADGRIQDTHGDYPEAVRLLAADLNVPLIDLHRLSREWLNGLGVEPSKKMFLWTEPDSRFPEGRKDDTHLSEEGAVNIAQLALKEARLQKLRFANYIQDDP